MDLDATLSVLAQQPTTPLDLAELALELARDEYPDLDVDAYLGELTAMAHEAKRYLTGPLPLRVRGLCRYLFHDMGFHGNIRDYYEPRNSYLNDVLDRQTGIPISLSLVAIAVAGRAGLPLQGVGLPGHFIVKAVEGDEEVLFDPFHGGRALTPESCEQLVERVTGKPFRADESGLQPLSTGGIAARLLNNLRGVYLRDGDLDRSRRVLQRLRQLEPCSPLHRRDLGLVFTQAGECGRAIDHLEAYLRALPTASDAAAVRQLLTQARGEVAKWN